MHTFQFSSTQTGTFTASFYWKQKSDWSQSLGHTPNPTPQWDDPHLLPLLLSNLQRSPSSPLVCCMPTRLELKKRSQISVSNGFLDKLFTELALFFSQPLPNANLYLQHHSLLHPCVKPKPLLLSSPPTQRPSFIHDSPISPSQPITQFHFTRKTTHSVPYPNFSQISFSTQLFRHKKMVLRGHCSIFTSTTQTQPSNIPNCSCWLSWGGIFRNARLFKSKPLLCKQNWGFLQIFGRLQGSKTADRLERSTHARAVNPWLKAFYWISVTTSVESNTLQKSEENPQTTIMWCCSLTPFGTKISEEETHLIQALIFMFIIL